MSMRFASAAKPLGFALRQATRRQSYVSSYYRVQIRSFSNQDDLKNTLNDIKKKYEEKKSAEGDNAAESTSQSQSFSSDGSGLSNFTRWARDSFATLKENVQLAYDEMVGEEKQSKLKVQLKQANSYKPPKQTSEDSEIEDSEDKPQEPAGPSAIVLVKEGKSAWESMKERLQDSPFIKEILKRTKVAGKVAGETDIGKQALNMGQNVKDKLSDAREIWETSQNPLIYTLSGVWDNVTGETEEGLATTAIRKLDPGFLKEEWAAEVRTNLAPKIIKAQLDGDLKTLKPWMGEAVYNKLAADIRVRKADGITIDSTILNIDENAIIMKILDDDRPIILIVYMVQQINCIQKKGEIIEGSETDIRAKFYTMAFHQNYDEDTQEVTWQIVDYEFAGDIPYY